MAVRETGMAVRGDWDGCEGDTVHHSRTHLFVINVIFELGMGRKQQIQEKLSGFHCFLPKVSV